MASPTPKRQLVPSSSTFEVVDPRWLLKAFALTLAVALLLAYLAVCLLVYQGAWQALLHPSADVARTPAAASLPYQAIAFDTAATGHPRLTAWSIPSATNPSSSPTLLFLHDGTGSLSDSLPTFTLLHALSVNVFAIDYRGFGGSQPTHPTEARMTEDTAAAFDYLVNTRHLPAASIIPYGTGLGASLAVSLALAHPTLPAIILDTPDPGAYARQLQQQRAFLLPMRLLLRDRFDIAATLPLLKTPKLLLSRSPSAPDPLRDRLFRTAPDPKMTVHLTQPESPSAYEQALRRFLDAYAAPTQLHPPPTPPQGPPPHAPLPQ